MNEIKQIGYMIIILALSVSVLGLWLLRVEVRLDKLSVETCEHYGAIRQKEFADTQWEDIDFTQSCLDNVLYATPLNRK